MNGIHEIPLVAVSANVDTQKCRLDAKNLITHCQNILSSDNLGFI